MNSLQQPNSSTRTLSPSFRLGIVAISYGPKFFLEHWKQQGTDRTVLYWGADYLSDALACARHSTDQKLQALWTRETEIFQRNGLTIEDCAKLHGKDRSAFRRGLRAQERRIDQIQAEELRGIGFASLAALLLLDRGLYRDLVKAGGKQVEW